MQKVILFFAANPKGTKPLRLDEEIREIDEGLRRAKHRDNFELRQKWAVRPEDLRRAMLDEHPNIVHFAGHGTGEKGIVLEDHQGVALPVTAQALSNLFALFPDVECVLLNACYSAIQAESISTKIKYVIGMTQAIGDSAAILFSSSFYDAIAAGKSVEFAFRFGCNALELAGIPENLTPILKINENSKHAASKTVHQQYDR